MIELIELLKCPILLFFKILCWSLGFFSQLYSLWVSVLVSVEVFSFITISFKKETLRRQLKSKKNHRPKKQMLFQPCYRYNMYRSSKNQYLHYICIIVLSDNFLIVAEATSRVQGLTHTQLVPAHSSWIQWTTTDQR